MRGVSRFEANLLRILHCLLRRVPLERALPGLFSGAEPPDCLGRDAVALLQDALGKGCVLLLARRGGWRRERFLRGERAVEGKLWERTEPEALALEFSAATPSFLVWLTATNFLEAPQPWAQEDRELTAGDRLFHFFAYDALRGTVVAKALRAQPAIARNALCRLAYCEDFTDIAPALLADWQPWLAGVGPFMIEALQPSLAERWREIELSKRKIVKPIHMRALGQSQAQALDVFLDQIDRAGRRDLARFVLHAAAELLGKQPPARDWVGSLELSKIRMAERVEVYAAAVAFLERLGRLRLWEQEARSVGYLDEGYEASQLWKADWERYGGEGLFEQARAIVRQLQPLGTGTLGHPREG